MWKIFDPKEVSFEPYTKGVADIKRIMKQKPGEGKFEGLGFLRVPSKGVFPQHTHPEKEEVYYIVSGSGTLLIEDKQIPVNEGAVLYVSGDTPHGLSNSSDQTLIVLYATAFV
jgi:quercetin dioxygenase-like cupin family protein